MSDPAMIAEMWQLVRETQRELKELAAAQQETRRLQDETQRELKELAAGQRETRLQVDRTSRELAEVGAYLKEVGQRGDRLQQRLDDLALTVDRATRSVEQAGRQVNQLTSSWGRFLESMVAPACERLFLERGLPVHQVMQRLRARRDGRTMEVDLVVVNEQRLVAVEVKSNLKAEDVREHLACLDEFKQFYRQFAGFQVMGAVAGMTLDEGADRFAYRHGLFVLAQSGEAVRLLNDPGFTPRLW